MSKYPIITNSVSIIIYNSITLTTDKMQSKIVHLDYKGLVIYDAFGVITEHDTFDILTL